LQPEPVSPELVLVDPELAERERARLVEKARLTSYIEVESAGPPSVVDIETLRRAVADDVSYWDEEQVTSRPRIPLGELARRKLLPAALMFSLLANGFLAADLIVRTDGRQAAAVVPAAERPANVSQVQSVAATAAAPRTVSTPQKTLVEQRLVALILRAPPHKLPHAFVDPATGLVKNNVRVVCRAARAGSYLCVVQLPAGGPSGGLVVRYRRARGGKGVFTWYGYRRGEGTTRFLQNRGKVGSKRLK
jgi:hypothetical protein